MRQHPAIPVFSAPSVYADPVAMLGSDIDNPVQTLYNMRDNQNSSWRIFGNGYIEVIPITGLTLKSNVGVEHVQFLNKNLTRNVRATDDPANRAVSSGYGQGDTWTWTNTANYLFDVAAQHHFTVLAGSEAIKYVFEDLAATRKDYAFEDADYMQIGSGSGTMTNGGGKQEWALFSLFGKLDYNFADRYLFSATLRRDQTSRLHKDHNSGIFPAFRCTATNWFASTTRLASSEVTSGSSKASPWVSTTAMSATASSRMPTRCPTTPLSHPDSQLQELDSLHVLPFLHSPPSTTTTRRACLPTSSRTALT